MSAERVWRIGPSGRLQWRDPTEPNRVDGTSPDWADFNGTPGQLALLVARLRREARPSKHPLNRIPDLDAASTLQDLWRRNREDGC